MTDKQALRMRNYLNTAVISGVKLLHLTTDELSGLLDELEAAQQERKNWRTSFDNERFRADKLAAAFNAEHEQLVMANRALITQHTGPTRQRRRLLSWSANWTQWKLQRWLCVMICVRFANSWKPQRSASPNYKARLNAPPLTSVRGNKWESLRAIALTFTVIVIAVKAVRNAGRNMLISLAKIKLSLLNSWMNSQSVLSDCFYNKIF
ncbi:TPA: hypothetical protein ACPT04_003223 [Klebsiella variicola]